MDKSDHCPRCHSVAFFVMQRPDVVSCLACGCEFQFQYIEDLSSENQQEIGSCTECDVSPCGNSPRSSTLVVPERRTF